MRCSCGQKVFGWVPLIRQGWRERIKRSCRGAGLAVLTATIYVLSAMPAVRLPPPADPEVFLYGVVELLALMGGRLLGGVILVTAACLSGAAAFAAERRSGTMEQLLATPADRGGIVLRRLAASGWVLLPAALVVLLADTVIYPMCPNVVTEGSPWKVALGAVLPGLSVISCAGIGLSLGVWRSLGCRTVIGAAVSAFGLVLACLAGELLVLAVMRVLILLVVRVAARLAVWQPGRAPAEVWEAFAVLVVMWLLLVRCTLAALIVRRTARRFDSIAARAGGRGPNR